MMLSSRMVQRQETNVDVNHASFRGPIHCRSHSLEIGTCSLPFQGMQHKKKSLRVSSSTKKLRQVSASIRRFVVTHR